MKENEKEINNAIEHLKVRNMSAKHIEMAIKALEEIQQYRAIGTVEELRDKNEPKIMLNIHISECADDIEAFGADTLWGYCPKCNAFTNNLYTPSYCGECGQAISWGEGG